MAFAGEIWLEKGWSNLAHKAVAFVFEGGVVGVAIDEYGRRALVKVEGSAKRKALEEAVSQLKAHKLHRAGKLLVVACDGQWAPASLASQIEKPPHQKTLEFTLGNERYVAWTDGCSLHFAEEYCKFVEERTRGEALVSAYLFDTLWICYRSPAITFINAFTCRSFSQYFYLHQCVAQAVGASSPSLFLLGEAVELGWTAYLKRWFRISRRINKPLKSFSPPLWFNTYGFLMEMCSSLWERTAE